MQGCYGQAYGEVMRDLATTDLRSQDLSSYLLHGGALKRPYEIKSLELSVFNLLHYGTFLPSFNTTLFPPPIGCTLAVFPHLCAIYSLVCGALIRRDPPRWTKVPRKVGFGTGDGTGAGSGMVAGVGSGIVAGQGP
jgi:hypothetical protein